jgi:hypothetical protein
MTIRPGIFGVLPPLQLSLLLLVQAEQGPSSSPRTQQIAPEAHNLQRYESLWSTPLFSLPAPPEVMPPPEPTLSPGYRLLGMGTTPAGVELAYVQPQLNGRPIEEISRSATTGSVLLSVERSHDGRVEAVVFRKGNEVIRALARATPLAAGAASNVPQSTLQGPPPPQYGSHVVRVPARLRNRALTLPK